MDNDKQVSNNNLTKARDHFLNFPQPDDSKDRDNFDLVGEFEKSSKNRSFRIPIFLIIFAAILGVGAWFISSATDKANADASFTIGSFEDLKLKDLLDTARKNQREFDTVSRQIEALKTESENRIQAIRIDAKNKIDLASLQAGGTERSGSINARAEAAIRAEKADLAAKLKPLEVQLAEAQKKIDGADDRVKEINQKAQAQLDGQQKLFEAEKKNLIAEYEARLKNLESNLGTITSKMRREREEYVALLQQKHLKELEDLKLKYNPKLVDANLLSLLNAYGDQVPTWPLFEQPERVSALIPSEVSDSLLEVLKKREALMAALNKVGYENSVPVVLSSLNAIDAEALATYQKYIPALSKAMLDLDSVIAEKEKTIADRETTIAGQQETITTKDGEIAAAKAKLDGLNKQLDQFSYVVSEYATTLKEDGYVVDGRNTAEILIFLKKDKAATITEATTFSVVDDKRANIGTITLTAFGNYYKVKTVTLTNPLRPLKVWDRITILKK